MPSTSGGVLRRRHLHRDTRLHWLVSMPSTSGGVLRPDLDLQRRSSHAIRFYALDVGRGVATRILLWILLVCLGFYALDVGRGVATDTISEGLRRER